VAAASRSIDKQLEIALHDTGDSPVTWIYAIVAVVAIALLFYLLTALLKPEWFQ